ncbi:MAG: DNA/RNA non-specific endonuclease [Gammaproteobacteria bacterium]|nr:DNA/RNA non-specific endonuclease [Gammaproteobacteria bacterium]
MKNRKPPLLTTGICLFSIVLFLSCLTHSGFAQSVAVTHCGGECPQHFSQLAANRAHVVIHHLYAAGLNGDTGLADWVSYRLIKDAVGVASLLPRNWQTDPLVGISEVEDILGLGEKELSLSQVASANDNPYAAMAIPEQEPEHRARLAPMTGFANTPYWPDLNRLSNMIPMPSPLRLGPWLSLEQRLNSLAAEMGELHVIAGPLYVINELSLSPIPGGLNPAAYYKLVFDDSGVVAFAFPHDLKQHEPLCAQRVEVSAIETMARISFFPDKSAIDESAALLRALGCQ